LKHFVLEYHTPTGKMRSLVQYDESGPAMDRYTELEKTVDDDTEVVVLISDSLDTIKQTHSRYFPWAK
jgi:hypothetical protein